MSTKINTELIKKELIDIVYKLLVDKYKANATIKLPYNTNMLYIKRYNGGRYAIKLPVDEFPNEMKFTVDKDDDDLLQGLSATMICPKFLILGNQSNALLHQILLCLS
ncbi:MAG: hypothetical protein DRG78_00280 [Epsilonproteobacteria bacterium]|nr:MAG: hypothetical protein DRG78_00280 [Campylobacterota bacterium]